MSGIRTDFSDSSRMLASYVVVSGCLSMMMTFHDGSDP